MIDPRIQYYMKVPLGDGTFTNGRIDYTAHPAMLGLDEIDLAGLRVLDIAANDGYWSFWAEQRRGVLAIDVDGFDGYDWGHDGPPSEASRQITNTVYSQWAEAVPGSGRCTSTSTPRSIARRCRSTNSIRRTHGEFDLIFNYGLIYHLRHPLLSLDTARGSAVVRWSSRPTSSTTSRGCRCRSSTTTTCFRGFTNWTGPTEASMAAWLRSAGFPFIKTAPSRPDPAQWPTDLRGVDDAGVGGSLHRAAARRARRAVLLGDAR